MTISPDLVCMRLGWQHGAPSRDRLHVRPIQSWSAGCARERGCQERVSSHAARIARSNAVPRIQRVPCLLCPVCLCCRAQCVVSGAAVAPATPAATLGTHAPVPMHPLEHSAGCVSQSLLRLRAFRWHVCACMRADFARPANRVIEHKVLCVCVLGPCFLCASDYFCSRGDMSVGTNKRHPVSSRGATSWVFACTHAHTLGYERM